MSDSTPRTIVNESPLSRATRITLVITAAATTLVFYVAAVASIAFTATIVVLFAVLTVGAARFGMASLFTSHVARQSKLLKLLSRNLWLSDGPTFRLKLEQEDAPRLFAMLEDLSARMGAAAPDEVSIEMSNGAWVQLEGYRRGAGKTILGVGYDLLVGLTEGEVEAVLAHEMAHARLVDRGVSRWLHKGLIRLARTSGDVSDHADSCRAAGRRSDLANALSSVFYALATRSTRLVSTYSRQDEFEADRGAAEICSATAMRSALLRLESLSENVARMPWSERVARVTPGESFSAWLTSQLTRTDGDDINADLPEHAVDPYSTHPSLRDRLAALASPRATVVQQRPGIELIAEPDRVAERLMAEIQRVLGELEAKDTKAIARSTRKFSTYGRVRPLQLLGFLFIAGGVIAVVSAFGDTLEVGVVVAAIVLFIAGGVCYRLGRYRDRQLLPVPAFGTLTNRRPDTETVEELSAAEEVFEAVLRERIGGIARKRARLAAYVEESWSALGKRDYLRAHVAARLGFGVDARSVEIAMSSAIASAGLGNFKQSTDLLAWLKKEAGLRTRNTKWALTWTLSLLGEWGEYTEGTLAQLHAQYPTEPTFASLLALAQTNRGKLQSAARNVATGRDLEPTNPEHTKLLASVLLAAGRARESVDQVHRLDSATLDPETLLILVRGELMLGDEPAARSRGEQLRTVEEGRWLVALGGAFESSRLYTDAASYYDEAVSRAFYPEAYMGLARIDVIRGDKQAARAHVLAALNFDPPLPPGAVGPGPLFHALLTQLIQLGSRREPCTRWIAALPVDEEHPLSGRSVMVCAPSRDTAAEHLRVVLSAIKPAREPVLVSADQWRHAPKDQQTERPIFAGVEFVVE